MWVTILNYNTGEVICKEYDSEEANMKGIEDMVAEEVGNLGDLHYMCTNNLALQINEKDANSIQHITKN